MKSRHAVVSSRLRRYALFLSLLAATLGMFAPVLAQAGSCMDGKLKANVLSLSYDQNTMMLDNVEINYSVVIAPRVTTKVECVRVGDETTDLICTGRVLYINIYYIKIAAPKRIKNPGFSSQQDSVVEKICADMDLTVYYVGGGRL